MGSSDARSKLGKPVTPRCHDLAQLDTVGGQADAPQRRRRSAENTAKARREVTVACKSGIEGDRRQVFASLEHRLKRMAEALLQDVVVDRGADHLTEHTAQMKG